MLGGVFLKFFSLCIFFVFPKIPFLFFLATILEAFLKCLGVFGCTEEHVSQLEALHFYLELANYGCL